MKSEETKAFVNLGTCLPIDILKERGLTVPSRISCFCFKRAKILLYAGFS
jgi:hypothetical protein